MASGLKKTLGNVSFSVISVAASAISSFLLVPLYVTTMGIDAYGYVALGLSFINISTVLSLAITSMSTRFIVVSLNKHENKANHYFNSIIFACVIVSAILLCLFAILSSCLGSVVVIENDFLFQTQLMLLLMAGSLCATIISTPFLAGQYFKNDLRLYYSFSAMSQLSRVAVPYALFWAIGPSLWLAFAAAFVVDSCALAVYAMTYKTFMPTVHVSRKAIDVTLIVEVLSSGCWTSISKAGSVLLGTVSTYLANILVGVKATGYYGSFIQLQSFITMFATAVISSLVPRILECYTNESTEALLRFASKLMRYVGIAIGICSGVAIALGVPFFNLWLGENTEEFGMEITLLLAYMPFVCPVEILNQVLIAQNRVKIPAIATIAFGVFNIFFSVFLCAGAHLGLLGIVVAQAVTTTVRAWVFFPMYTAAGFRSALRELYVSLATAPLAMCVSYAISHFVLGIMPIPAGWGYFALDVFVCTMASCLVCLLFVRRDDRRAARAIIRAKTKGLQGENDA